MKIRPLLVAVFLFVLFSHITRASQADDTTITIDGQTAGPTPFISQLELAVSDTSVLAEIQFTVASKPGSVIRPFKGTYSRSYLESRGYLNAGTGQVFLPVFGLYASYGNTVDLTYFFLDGSSKGDSIEITTADYSDACGYATPTVLQARTTSTDLSYDYMFVRGACESTPLIIDTDGAVRWISPFPSTGVLTAATGFFDGAAYVTLESSLYRVDLDGTVTFLKDYSDLGVINFHHNIDLGKTGIILDADTDTQLESVNFEADRAGNVLQTWNMADIISAAMVVGGDDPSQFVYPTPTDWFHNNAVTYRPSDNSLIVSGREDFVISINYEANTINWILGDITKKWYQFPSLNQYALALAPGSLPPIGQHALSITGDNSLLLMDNGQNSLFQDPMGEQRTYSSPRKYELDLETNIATEIWNYEREQSVFSPFCSSIYEDAPLNYLIDYAIIFGGPVTTAELLGLDAAGNKIFDYLYPTSGCNTAYNSIPFHAEQLLFTTTAQALNISTRGSVMGGDNVLIAGLIITGFDSKDVVLRAIGPSLADVGVSGALANPVLTLYDSSGAIVATNDDWQTDPSAAEIQALGIAPANASEAATVQKLTPGVYTVVISGKDDTTGIALVEAYDLSRNSNSNMGNISTRGFVGPSDEALIAGFIIGDRNDATVVIRAIGPSLTTAGITGALSDPKLTVYDSNGVPIGSNDNWQDDANASIIQLDGLAPVDPAESATLATLSPGSYTAVVQGADGGSGVGLAEVYNLP